MHVIYLAVIKFCRYYSCLLSTPNAKFYKTATLRKNYERKIPVTMTQRHSLYTVLRHSSQIIMLALPSNWKSHLRRLERHGINI